MRQIKFLLLSFFLIAFSSNFVFSSHVAGGNISIVYTGTPNTYLVTLSLFRDCSGIDAPAAPSVFFDNDCGFAQQAVQFPNVLQQEVSAIDTSFCPDVSICEGGTLPGMQLFQYQSIVTLAPCNSWTIWYSLSARNPTSNIGGGNFYTQTVFNSATNSTNTTPSIVWTPTNGFDPIPYGCAGFQKSYALNVHEPDGDSLTFSFTSALQATGAPVTYTAPATAANPIPGITIDPNTGLMNFTAANPGKYVITVLIDEYDSFGNLLSSTMHDFQFVVEICANNSPVAPNAIVNYANFSTNAQYNAAQNSISMCVGDQFCFDVTFSDPDGDSIGLSTNVFDILPGGTFDQTFSSLAGDTVTGQVCWTYQPGYSGSIISITAKELICVPGSSTFSINLNIPPYLNVSKDDSICGIQTANLSATGQGPITWSVISGEPIAPSNFSCNNCNTPVATPSMTTTYLVEDGSICNLTDIVTVFVADNFGGLGVEIFTDDDSLCPDNCLQVEAITWEVENIPIVAGPWVYNGIATDVPINSIVDVAVPTAVAQMAPQTTITPGMICEVCVDIDHNHTGDLKLELVAPNGAAFVLSDQNGGAGNDYDNTCFVMDHPQGLALPVVNSPGAYSPFPGPHQPQNNLNNALIGAPIGGTTSGNWRLRVDNNGSHGIATVNTWSIKFCRDSLREFQSSFFAWDNQDGMPLIDTIDPSVCPQFGGQYILTAYTVDYCFINDTININLYELPDPGNDTTVEVCLETGVIDLFTFLGGTPHNNGTWEDINGNPVNPLINSNAVIDSLPYLYIAESVNGCLDSSYLIVDIIEVTIDNTVITPTSCNGFNDGEITVFATMADSYSINSPTPTQASNVFTNLFAGTYDITAFYTLPDFNYCAASATNLEVTEPTLLTLTDFTVNYLPGNISLNATNSVTIQGCEGKTVPLSANSDLNSGNPAGTHVFDWYMNNNYIGVGKDWTTPTNEEGPGYVVLNDGYCPGDTAFYNIDHYTGITPVLSIPNPEGCPGHEVTFNDLSVVTNENNNTFNSATLHISNGDAVILKKLGTKGYILNEAGQYSVIMEINSSNINSNTGGNQQRALHSCKYEITNYDIVIRENPKVDFVATPDKITIYEPTSSMQNISPTGGANDATDWYWNFGTHGKNQNNLESNESTDKNPSIVYPDAIPGKYLVYLSGSRTYTPAIGDSYTCTATEKHEVQIVNDVNIFAPNIFTPDGNSYNETWKVHISGIDIYDFELTIYNRYGEIVFQSFDSEAAWNGTYGNNGNIVQDGTYPWVVTAKDAIDDNKYQFKGTITIAK